jgi:hypothetical protein
MRRTLPLLALALIVQSLPANAMGSGDKYQDLQTGVTYLVYKPAATTIKDLPQLNFEVRPCRLFPKRDEYLLAGFGGMEVGISLVETSAKFNCTGFDNPAVTQKIKVNSLSATLGIYCPTKTCKSEDVSKYGGEISFTAPGNKNLQSTFIRVGTRGYITYKQLLAFATGLKPVGSK